MANYTARTAYRLYRTLESGLSVHEAIDGHTPLQLIAMCTFERWCRDLFYREDMPEWDDIWQPLMYSLLIGPEFEGERRDLYYLHDADGPGDRDYPYDELRHRLRAVDELAAIVMGTEPVDDTLAAAMSYAGIGLSRLVMIAQGGPWGLRQSAAEVIRTSLMVPLLRQWDEWTENEAEEYVESGDMGWGWEDLADDLTDVSDFLATHSTDDLKRVIAYLLGSRATSELLYHTLTLIGDPRVQDAARVAQDIAVERGVSVYEAAREF